MALVPLHTQTFLAQHGCVGLGGGHRLRAVQFPGVQTFSKPPLDSGSGISPAASVPPTMRRRGRNFTKRMDLLLYGDFKVVDVDGALALLQERIVMTMDSP